MSLVIPAVIPAAGISRRMGQPKLVLPFQGATVLQTVVAALREGGCDRVLVVAPSRDRAESVLIENLASEAGADVIVPEVQPPDMRSSLLLGLKEIEKGCLETPPFLVLSPGDALGMTAHVVACCLERALCKPGRLVVPVAHGLRGHPLILPWKLVEEIRQLPDDLGVNWVVRNHEAELELCEIDEAWLAEDLDTPEDYERWSKRSRAEV